MLVRDNGAEISCVDKHGFCFGLDEFEGEMGCFDLWSCGLRPRFHCGKISCCQHGSDVETLCGAKAKHVSLIIEKCIGKEYFSVRPLGATVIPIMARHR